MSRLEKYFIKFFKVFVIICTIPAIIVVIITSIEDKSFIYDMLKMSFWIISIGFLSLLLLVLFRGIRAITQDKSLKIGKWDKEPKA